MWSHGIPKNSVGRIGPVGIPTIIGEMPLAASEVPLIPRAKARDRLGALPRKGKYA